MPFPVKAIQVDGGSEFQSAFEEACQEMKLPLFVLPPRSPKLNGHVERAQRTHTEEFYELYDGDLEMAPLNEALRNWERVYNHVRPHQALGYLTPHQYLLDKQKATQVHSSDLSAVPCQTAKSRPATPKGAPTMSGLVLRRWYHLLVERSDLFHYTYTKGGMCTGCTGRVHGLDTLGAM